MLIWCISMLKKTVLEGDNVPRTVFQVREEASEGSHKEKQDEIVFAHFVNSVFIRSWKSSGEGFSLFPFLKPQSAPLTKKQAVTAANRVKSGFKNVNSNSPYQTPPRDALNVWSIEGGFETSDRINRVCSFSSRRRHGSAFSLPRLSLRSTATTTSPQTWRACGGTWRTPTPATSSPTPAPPTPRSRRPTKTWRGDWPSKLSKPTPSSNKINQ